MLSNRYCLLSNRYVLLSNRYLLLSNRYCLLSNRYRFFTRGVPLSTCYQIVIKLLSNRYQNNNGWITCYQTVIKLVSNCYQIVVEMLLKRC